MHTPHCSSVLIIRFVLLKKKLPIFMYRVVEIVAKQNNRKEGIECALPVYGRVVVAMTLFKHLVLYTRGKRDWERINNGTWMGQRTEEDAKKKVQQKEWPYRHLLFQRSLSRTQFPPHWALQIPWQRQGQERVDKAWCGRVSWVIGGIWNSSRSLLKTIGQLSP